MAVFPKKTLNFLIFHIDLTCDEGIFFKNMSLLKVPTLKFGRANHQSPNRHLPCPSAAPAAHSVVPVFGFRGEISYMSINLQFPEVLGDSLGNFPYTEIAGNQRESSNQWGCEIVRMSNLILGRTDICNHHPWNYVQHPWRVNIMWAKSVKKTLERLKHG